MAVLLVAGCVALAAVQGGRTTSDAAASSTKAAAEGSTTTTATTAAPPSTTTIPSTVGTHLTEVTRLTGELTPKSVVASNAGVVLAQNMIYKRTISAYKADGTFLKTIPSTVDLAAFGITGYPAGEVEGGPVELAFSPDGTKAYTSNYEMYGPGFAHPGDDVCSPSAGYDNSFVYRLDVKTLTIDQVIEVGPVPKYVATTPDGRYVLVTNWCGYDLSVIDTALGKEVQRLSMGAYPRGIVVSPDSSTAYVAIMGGTEVLTVDLSTFAVGTLGYIGSGPRHLVLSPDGKTMYVTLNGEGRVASVDVATGTVLAKVTTGQAPRSMAISADGASLYVVNYDSNTMTKLNAADMSEVQEIPTDGSPIGITYDSSTGDIWVACYSGSLTVFHDG